jgi:hypothetical protein
MEKDPYAAPQYYAPPPPQPLKVPAICLLVVAVFALLWSILALGFDFYLLSSDLPEQMRDPGGIDKRTSIYIRTSWGIAMAICDVIVIAAAIAMLKLRNFALAKTGAIISVIPCCGPCFVLGLPFGVWALMELNRPAVRNQFES